MGPAGTALRSMAGTTSVWFQQCFDTVSEDVDPIFWSLHIKSTSNLRSLLSVRQPDRTTLLIVHLLSSRRINSDVAGLFLGLSLRPFMPLVGKYPAEFDFALKALLQGRSRGIYICRSGVNWFSQCTGMPESGWSPRDVPTSADKHDNRISTSKDQIRQKMKSRKESTAEKMVAQADNVSDSVLERSADETVWMVKQPSEVPHQLDAIFEDRNGTVVKEDTVTNINCDLEVPTRPCVPPEKTGVFQQDLLDVILELIGRDRASRKVPTLVGLNPKRVVNHTKVSTGPTTRALRLKSTSQTSTQSVNKYPESHVARISQAHTIRSSSRGVLCRNRGGRLMRVVTFSSKSDDNLTKKAGTRQVRRCLTDSMYESIRSETQKVFGRPYRRAGVGRGAPLPTPARR